MSLDVMKWIRGWRLDKFFDELLKTKNEAGQVTVQASCQKVIGVIDQTLALWAQYEPLFNSIVSDDAEVSADKIKAVIEEIKAKLATIVIIPDIPESLQEYRFADNDEWNAFYHSLVTTGALAFSDGKISLFEGISFVGQIGLFIKSQND